MAHEGRAIAAAKESGWTFVNIGPPLDFEQVERYSARRIRDRFTLEMLRDYLVALDVRAFDADWYMPEGEAILVEMAERLSPPAREWTLEEVREYLMQFNPYGHRVVAGHRSVGNACIRQLG